MTADEVLASAAEQEAHVHELARRLVAAFGAGDLRTYFACFADDASFAFHTSPEVLTSAQAYREAWEEWVRTDGFTVLQCHTSEQHWQVWENAAVLVHRVATTVRAAGTVSTLDERETIVFQRRTQGWRAVHEHLSVHPSAAQGC